MTVNIKPFTDAVKDRLLAEFGSQKAELTAETTEYIVDFEKRMVNLANGAAIEELTFKEVAEALKEEEENLIVHAEATGTVLAANAERIGKDITTKFLVFVKEEITKNLPENSL